MLGFNFSQELSTFFLPTLIYSGSPNNDTFVIYIYDHHHHPSVLLWDFRGCNGRIFSFKMHHQFSEPVKQWSQSTEKLYPAGGWPRKGSHEYYAELAHHDRALHRRSLSGADSVLAFSTGNSTLKISSLGLYVILKDGYLFQH